jgi:hypothetical protein
MTNSEQFQSKIRTERLALYTTIYPGVEKYMSDWNTSILKQTDQNFDLWIGSDGVDIDRIRTGVDIPITTEWVVAKKGDSPAQVRQRTFEQIIHKYPAIILVDSDDLLEPTRVEAAREGLLESDVVGCAMRIVNKQGDDVGVSFKLPNGMDMTEIPVRNNIFGLSNTAYRTEILAQCLPIPWDCILVDWFLITRAWTLNARLGYDFKPRMAYRQHGNNVAVVLPPFTPAQVLLATNRVLEHYQIVFANVPELQPHHRFRLEVARDYVATFRRSIEGDSDKLGRYTHALNQLPPNHVWWSCVAHPELEEVWKS